MGGAICLTAQITGLKKNSHHLSNFKEHSQPCMCSGSRRKLHIIASTYSNIVFFLNLYINSMFFDWRIAKHIVITYQQPM